MKINILTSILCLTPSIAVGLGLKINTASDAHALAYMMMMIIICFGLIQVLSFDIKDINDMTHFKILRNEINRSAKKLILSLFLGCGAYLIPYVFKISIPIFTAALITISVYGLFTINLLNKLKS